MKSVLGQERKQTLPGFSLRSTLAAGLVAWGLFLASDPVRGQEETLPAPTPFNGEVAAPPDLKNFPLESEAVFLEQLRKVPRPGVTPAQVRLPKEPTATETFVARHWASLRETVVPGYVCYGRLFFEQKNSERYGWDLGLLHPLLSAGIFYFDVLTLPYHAGTDPFRCYECSAGYCLPGDPVPLLLYPPELSITGALDEAATIGILATIFP